jgi:hypothetical protein
LDFSRAEIRGAAETLHRHPHQTWLSVEVEVTLVAIPEMAPSDGYLRVSFSPRAHSFRRRDTAGAIAPLQGRTKQGIFAVPPLLSPKNPPVIEKNDSGKPLN